MYHRARQLAVLLAAGATSAAGATTILPATTEQKSVVVRYDASELVSEAGAERMYTKLDRAARSVCNDDEIYDPIYLRERSKIRACEQMAIANAVEDVRSANLTSEYNRHFPRDPLAETEHHWDVLHAVVIVWAN